MEFKGQTLEEALQRAEVSTGRSRNEMIYKVVEKKSGFLKGKEFYIKIDRYKEKTKIGLKNGKPIFTIGDIPPSVEPGGNISIIINGRRIKEKTPVSEIDAIEINAIDSELVREINLSLSEDGMNAFIETTLIPERRYIVCDSEENTDLKVEAKLVKEEYPAPFTIEEIEEALRQKNISYGIKWDRIREILDGGKCIAAEGLPPEKSVSDEIKYLFGFKKENKPVEVHGRVDYYNIGETEFVEPGEILALRNEGKDGKPGYNIFGNTINPEKRQIKNLFVGSGCETVENGNKIVASIKGMPSIRNERVFVFPVHIINGDVDIKTGNINFEGDILIKGNIKEGLGVYSGNNLTVQGEAAEANLSACGNVVIQKNIISSKITAGEKQLMDTKAIEYIKEVNKFFSGMLEAFNDIKNNSQLPDNIKDSQIFKLLLESKFKKIKKEMLQAGKLVSNEISGDDVYNVLKTSFGIYKLIENNVLSSANILANQINRNSDYISKYELLLNPADVIVGYCQNSEINATNNLVVVGKGCYNTNVCVQNKAVFTGSPGIFRGGQIYAKNSILLKEAGSPAGVLTILRTSRDGIIEVNIAYPNTVINIGDQVYKIDYPVKMLKAYMQKGEIVVEKLKA